MFVNKSFLVHTRLDNKLLISNEVTKLNPGLITVYRSLRLVVLLLSYCLYNSELSYFCILVYPCTNVPLQKVSCSGV